MDKIGKELIFNGICLGTVCAECNGRKGGYQTEIRNGKRDFVYGGWRGEDPVWQKCKACRGKGVVDSEEGAALRQWLGK